MGIPETFIINREGRISYKHAGELTVQIIDSKIDEALRGIVSKEGSGKLTPIR